MGVTIKLSPKNTNIPNIFSTLHSNLSFLRSANKVLDAKINQQTKISCNIVINKIDAIIPIEFSPKLHANAVPDVSICRMVSEIMCQIWTQRTINATKLPNERYI